MTEDCKKTVCKVCRRSAIEIDSSDHGSEFRLKCERCGEFTIRSSARGRLANLSLQQIAKLSGWIFQQNSKGSNPTINRDTVGWVINQPLLPIRDRINGFLREAIKHQSRLGSSFDVNEPRFIAATYSQDFAEVEYLSKVLISKGMIGRPTLDSPHEILFKGYDAIDSFIRKNEPSGTGFVAMSFSNHLYEVYESGIKVGIMNAGYDPIRVDNVEHTNRIDDEIIVQIKESDFVVADLTEQNRGVYFEAGFALGLDLPVIWTCRKDDMESLHFDIRQFNTISWESKEDLAERLKNRIESVVGVGPRI